MRFVVTSILLSFFTSHSFAQLKHPTKLRFNFAEQAREIHLAWDEVENAVGYNVFVKKQGDKDFVLIGEAGMLYQNTFNYNLKSEFGQYLEFAVCAVNNYPSVERSALSETVKVETPSIRLPMVKLNMPKIKNGHVSVSWEYQYEIQDLSSFVLFINGIPKPISKTKKTVIIDSLPKGNYAIEMRAQSKSGVASPYSVRRFFTVP